MEQTTHLTVCQRSEPRMHLRVAAELTSRGSSVPVKIRNLSPSGGRIEGGDRLQTGARFQLRRGKLSVEGEIRWIKAGQCGLAFDTPVDVYEWLSQANAHQGRVDQVLEAVRAGCGPGLLERWNDNSADSQCAELRKIADNLDALAEVLCEHEDLFEQHHDKLQCLDVAAQRFRVLARSVIDRPNYSH